MFRHHEKGREQPSVCAAHDSRVLQGRDCNSLLQIVGSCYNTSNLVEHSFPCVLTIAAKYWDKPEAALIVSANLGGDSSGRTALVGALMGKQDSDMQNMIHTRAIRM